MHKGFVIAIDGPAAAGKGTIAPRLAKKLNGFYLYTGAMYRCLALQAKVLNVDLNDKIGLISLLPYINIEFNDDKVFLNGRDVTSSIKDTDIASSSSKVALIPQVRKDMLRKQQDMAKKAIEEGKIVVAEGRDTGTVVFPDAKLKVFLTATPEVRAKRRLEQLEAQGAKQTFETTLKEVKERDKRDKERKADPLVSDPKKFGYFVLDNSKLSEKETLEIIIKKLK
jgi:CMP/dCMP kinase